MIGLSHGYIQVTLFNTDITRQDQWCWQFEYSKGKQTALFSITGDLGAWKGLSVIDDVRGASCHAHLWHQSSMIFWKQCQVLCLAYPGTHAWLWCWKPIPLGPCLTGPSFSQLSSPGDRSSNCYHSFLRVAVAGRWRCWLLSLNYSRLLYWNGQGQIWVHPIKQATRFSNFPWRSFWERGPTTGSWVTASSQGWDKQEQT